MQTVKKMVALWVKKDEGQRDENSGNAPFQHFWHFVQNHTFKDLTQKLPLIDKSDIFALVALTYICHILNILVGFKMTEIALSLAHITSQEVPGGCNGCPWQQWAFLATFYLHCLGPLKAHDKGPSSYTKWRRYRHYDLSHWNWHWLRKNLMMQLDDLSF